MVRVEVTLHAKVAALYIDPRGPYPRMAAGEVNGATFPNQPRAIDCWDAKRDARLYAGPHPVVAHPPCKHWGRLRHLAKDAECAACNGTGRYVDPQWARGHAPCLDCKGTGRVSDRDCAPRAVEQVRAFGGVLEHPAGSKLWEACGLPTPQQHELVRTADTSDWEGPLFPRRDAHGGWCVEVAQVEWGHVARKRTWLYLVGVPREALEAPPFPGREPTHRIGSSTCGRENGTRYRPASGLRSASAQQRRRTPPLFAEYLVRLARAVRRP